MKKLLRFLLAVLSFTLCVRGQNFRLASGLVDHQVFQRDSNNTASFSLSGDAAGSDRRTVQARLLLGGIELEGFSWSPLAMVTGNKWSGAIKRVPTGGPYRLELRIEGSTQTLVAEDLLVGDLWVLGGQSNMEGCGNLVKLEQPHPLVHSFDLTDRWLLARDPLHRSIDAVDPVHREGKPRLEGVELQKAVAGIWRGAGLGLPFAVEMVRRTGVPIGLIPCASGGTTMEQWAPTLKNKGGDSLYGSMLGRVKSVGGKVAGMLWYQGEAETFREKAVVFKQRFEDFVSAVRAHFGEPQLPFYYVQIGRFITTEARRRDEAWNQVQEAQRMAETDLTHAGMVAAIDAEMDDIIHLGSEGLRHVGHRLANLACHDLFPEVNTCRGLKPGPRLAAITLENQIRDEFSMRVKFSGVNGGLRSTGRVSGFSIHSADGNVMPVIFKARIDPEDRNSVLLSIHVQYGFGTLQLPPGATLRYGYGKDPYCNLTDEADMAVPVFGPITIPSPK